MVRKIKTWNQLAQSSKNAIVGLEKRLWQNGVKPKDLANMDKNAYDKRFNTTISESGLKGQKRLADQLVKYRSNDATKQLLKNEGFTDAEAIKRTGQFIQDFLDLEPEPTTQETDKQETESGDSDSGGFRKTDYKRLRQWAIDNDYDPDLIWEMDANELFDFLQSEGEAL